MNQVERVNLAQRASHAERLSGTVSPETVSSLIPEGLRALGEPVGHPDGLEELAEAFRRAGSQLDTLCSDASSLATRRLPEAWKGAAAESASGDIHAKTREIEGDVEEFNSVDKVIRQAADDLRTSHREHAELRGRLIDMGHKARALPADSARSPEAVDLAREAGDTFRATARLLTRVHDEDKALAAKLTIVNEMETLPSFLVGGTDSRKSIDQILKEYQVSPDPEGMVEFPSGPLGWLADQLGMEPKEMTAGEARLLEDLGAAGIKDAYDIYEEADVSGRTAFGGQGETDGHADAFRHTYWNAMLANRFGSEWTESFTTAHERLPQDKANSASVEAMDLHNNEVGRRIAAQHPDASPEELKQHVEDAVRNGDVVVHDRNGELKHSDQVDIGNSGEAKGAPDQGGKTPEPNDGQWSGGYNPGNDGDSYGTTDGNY